MTLTVDMQRILAFLNGGPLDYATFLEAIHRARYTGPYTVHCLNGTPQRIDLGAPIQLSIVEGRKDRT